MRCKHYLAFFPVVLLLFLVGCAARTPPPISFEPVPPLPADSWREIREEIWTASTLAGSEANFFARQAMQEWMGRVRERIDEDFVPWYSGYWTQQWIGLKAGWYEINRADDDESVEKYLTDYLREQFSEIVLMPAGAEADPRTITKQAADLYVRLLSMQLRCLPEMHAATPRSLLQRLDTIPLIALPGTTTGNATLSQVFESNNLDGTPAYDALITQASSLTSLELLSPADERLQVVTEQTVERLLAELPVRAGGGVAATVIGEALGLFVSAGVAAWSANRHDQQKPAIESQLKEVLEAGLNDVWKILMEDPDLGVLFPVNHMTQQVETGLFPPGEPYPMAPF